MKKVLLREGEPDCLPFYEFGVDAEIAQAIINKPCNTIESSIEFNLKMGYDYASASIPFFYPRDNMLATADTAPLSKERRVFLDANKGMIENRKDFDAYPWPPMPDDPAHIVNAYAAAIPSGMKVLVGVPGGMLENAMWLMGYVPFSYAIHDDEQLVWDLFEKIGNDFTRALKLCLQKADIGKIGGLMMGDDMGFSHSTMISPELMRKYVFPWQKKLVAVSHEYELPFILHSCGNIDSIMDDLIDYVGIDAKHSFEDKIMPVAEVKKRYGKRVAILGGVDMGMLASGSAGEVYDYTVRLIDVCAPGGGFALGSGNSVSNYVPPENYFAMLDAGWAWDGYGKQSL